MIGKRPAVVERRQQLRHWEIDPLMGPNLGQSSDCIARLVERKSGYMAIGELEARTVEQTTWGSCPWCEILKSTG